MSCQSLLTSASCGWACRRLSSGGTQVLSASREFACRVNWYWVRLTVVSMVRSWVGCR